MTERVNIYGYNRKYKIEFIHIKQCLNYIKGIVVTFVVCTNNLTLYVSKLG